VRNINKGEAIYLYKLLRCYLFHKFKRPYPLVANLWVTYRCNQKCVYCYNYKKSVERELTTAEIFKFIDELHKLKIPLCTVSGGEPLLRSDIVEIGKYLKKKNIKSSISTNGTLITEELGRELVEAYDVIIISLDGPEEIHDKVRGMKNAFKLATNGIKILKKHAYKNSIGISYVLHKYNFKEFIPFARKLYKTKLVDFITLNPVNTIESLFPPLDELRLEVKRITRFKRKFPSFLRPTISFLEKIPNYFSGEKFLCNTGGAFFTVEPDGKVRPCDCMDVWTGNIRHDSLEKILSSQKKDLEKIKANCPGCLFESTIEISDIMNSNPFRVIKDALPMLRHYISK
jgi:MoaA/NifB/PqqE/SkfB family radical SAM enzyme